MAKVEKMFTLRRANGKKKGFLFVIPRKNIPRIETKYIPKPTNDLKSVPEKLFYMCEFFFTSHFYHMFSFRNSNF